MENPITTVTQTFMSIYKYMQHPKICREKNGGCTLVMMTYDTFIMHNALPSTFSNNFFFFNIFYLFIFGCVRFSLLHAGFL